jgi:hypothetical protein
MDIQRDRSDRDQVIAMMAGGTAGLLWGTFAAYFAHSQLDTAFLAAILILATGIGGLCGSLAVLGFRFVAADLVLFVAAAGGGACGFLWSAFGLFRGQQDPTTFDAQTVVCCFIATSLFVAVGSLSGVLTVLGFRFIAGRR